MDHTILRTLEEASFSPKEARIYVALLELGQGDITDIARATDLKRSNIYPLLEKLERRGYVSEVPGSPIKRYIPADPTRILYHLQSTTSTLRDMLPIIRGLYNQPGYKPRVQYFEGEAGVVSVYREINQFSEAFFLSSISRFKQAMPNDYAYWIKGLAKGTVKYKAKFLLPKTEEDIAFARACAQLKHEIRWLPDQRNISLEFALYGNKLAISSFDDHVFVVVIESSTLHQSMKEIFSLLWANADKKP